MRSTIPGHVGSWTFDQVADLPDDGRRYEVVDGSLVVSPPPTQRHQWLSNALLRQLVAQCTGPWAVLLEWPVPMGSDGRVPDLAVVSTGVAPGRGGPPFPLGPDAVGLVVEVVSASSRKTDRFAKPGEYAEAGIPLVWRLETEPELLLLAHRLVGGAYEQVAAVTRRGEAPVPWGTATVDLALLAG